jgi:phage tail tape-measure protein
MAFGLTSTGGYTARSARSREAQEVSKAGGEGASSGSVSGAFQGATQGATLGMALGPLGMVGGAIAGAALGGLVGGKLGKDEAQDAKRAELNSKRRTDILTRQESTTRQQQARMGQTSKVKTPRMTAPSATDASLVEMPSASGKGTAYDAWRTTVYGG